MNLESRHFPPSPPRRLIKPRGFTPARQVTRAEFCVDGPAAFTGPKAQGRTASQKRGKKYEREALAALEEHCNCKLFMPSPWIEFDEPKRPARLCQPDALGFGEDVNGPWALIFEIKLRHTIMAYWQLRHLYEPVIRAMFPHYRVNVCEVTRSFDPSTPWPEEFDLHYEFDVLSALDGRFVILQWRP